VRNSGIQSRASSPANTTRLCRALLITLEIVFGEVP
jgi:hypothetical protein